MLSFQSLNVVRINFPSRRLKHLHKQNEQSSIHNININLILILILY